MKTPQNKIKVLPSILSADFGRFIEEAQSVDIPEVDYLHIDVMDGHFVPNLTVGPQIVESLKRHTRFKLDVHLMVDNAPDLIPRFAESGADFITIHEEGVTHLHRHIHQIKKLGIQAGVTINPSTPVENLRWVLNEVDLILIMSVNPGFGGQQFIPFSVEKIRSLHTMRQKAGADFIIEVDGGIDPGTAGPVYLAGAQYLVVGSAIFGKTDRPKAIRDIIQAVETEDRRNSSQLV